VGTLQDFADYYRMPPSEARPRLAELVETGEVLLAKVEGWKETGYLHKDAASSRVRAAALLSPFDPVVWFRARAKRLFDFAYRIEIYTPASQRKWGYYVLPFLLGDRMVARVDLRAERKQRVLAVVASYLEPHADAAAVASALAGELQSLARWLDLDEVHVGRRGNLARALTAEVQKF
jgi:uncharacterized protein YcaQ